MMSSARSANDRRFLRCRDGDRIVFLSFDMAVLAATFPPPLMRGVGGGVKNEADCPRHVKRGTSPARGFRSHCGVKGRTDFPNVNVCRKLRKSAGWSTASRSGRHPHPQPLPARGRGMDGAVVREARLLRSLLCNNGERLHLHALHPYESNVHRFGPALKYVMG